MTTARDVLDYIEWKDYQQTINDLCPSTPVAVAISEMYDRLHWLPGASSSAMRGRHLRPQRTETRKAT